MHIREIPEGLLLSVYVQPRAGKNLVCGVHNNSIKLKIKAVPADNKANEELQKFLSRKLGLARSNIRIIQGEKNRNKTILLSTHSSEIKNILDSWEC